MSGPALPRWLRVVIRVIRRSLHGQITVTAGGIALFAVLAAVPTLGAVVSVYGLVADPHDIQTQLDGLDRVLPHAVVQFVIAQLEAAARSSSSQLGATLVTSVVVAVFSARNATNAVIAGLNNSYGLIEERTALRKFATSLVVSGASLVGILLVITVVIVFPTTTRLLGIGGPGSIASYLRWPVILVVVVGLLMALYRTAPSGGTKTPRRIVPGAVVGTLCWLLVSFGLSVWVDRVADYEFLYGAFAGAIVVLIWFYLSALSILIGASINAELGPSGHRHRWRMSAGRKGPIRDRDRDRDDEPEADPEAAAAAASAAADPDA